MSDDFSHIPRPPERYETAAARASLSGRLSFADDPAIQDWERAFCDFDRIEEFIALYVEGSLDDDERHLLMHLILASAAFDYEQTLDPRLWRDIDGLLRKDWPLHADSVWLWADIDPETGMTDNEYAISPRLQAILIDKYETPDGA